ncbi:hypothetical protein BGZ76_002329 [Entomortierella beljakovae]|nr:hypothetical protein BGZ76_002329 [Entomortierella beljakovae]
METYPTLSAQDISLRKEYLKEFDGFRNNGFFANNLMDIYYWHHSGHRLGRARSPEMLRVTQAVIDRYVLIHSNEESVPQLSPHHSLLDVGLGALFQNIGLNLADQGQGLLTKNTTELLHRVKNRNNG